MLQRLLRQVELIASAIGQTKAPGVWCHVDHVRPRLGSISNVVVFAVDPGL